MRVMGRLFLRVFLWFWIGSTSLVLVLAVTLLMAQPDVVGSWRFVGRTAMTAIGSQMAAAYEREGAMRAAALAEEAGRDGGVRLWLYDADGNLVAGSAPPADHAEALRTARASAGADPGGSRAESALATRIASDSGRSYVVVWETPRPLRWPLQPSALRFSARVAAMALTSGLVCWLLTWQITKPIRRLQGAARRFADGDLAVRVAGTPGLDRGDELAELARDFDHMAANVEASIAARHQLLADISHELRSPLARLSLALDLARRRLGDQVPEHQRIEQEIHRLDELIGQLLTLGRMQGPATATPEERVALGDLVRDVVRDAQFEAEASDRRVAVDGLADVAVKGHRELLRSAIENVIRNAVRHTAPGSTVSVVLEQAEPQRLAIVVRDHGPGVPHAALHRLFDPFFRVDDARDRASGGVGLGLAIARQAILAHGGSATAANHPDGGLVIRLDLPLQT